MPSKATQENVNINKTLKLIKSNKHNTKNSNTQFKSSRSVIMDEFDNANIIKISDVAEPVSQNALLLERDSKLQDQLDRYGTQHSESSDDSMEIGDGNEDQTVPDCPIAKDPFEILQSLHNQLTHIEKTLKEAKETIVCKEGKDKCLSCDFGQPHYHYLNIHADFAYHIAIGRNYRNTGLLHSFFRHSDDFMRVIPGFRDLLKRSLDEEYHSLLRAIGTTNLDKSGYQPDGGWNYTEKAERKRKIETFWDTHRSLWDTKKYRRVIFEVQERILNYVNEIVQQREKFLGGSVNDSNEILYHFNAETINGEPVVMLLNITSNLYLPDETASNVSVGVCDAFTIYFNSEEKAYGKRVRT